MRRPRYYTSLNQCLRAAFRVASRYGQIPLFDLF